MTFLKFCNVCENTEVTKRCERIECDTWFCKEHKKLAVRSNCFRSILRIPK